MVKPRDEHGRVEGVKLRVVFGQKAAVLALLGESAASIERCHPTSRPFNGRQVRKPLAFPKDTGMNRVAAIWEDSYYNLARPHKSLRSAISDVPASRWRPRTPAMTKLTDHMWTVKERLTILPLPKHGNTS